MNKTNKKFMSLFMGLMLLGSFNAVNASESTKEAFKARLENAAKLLVSQYGHYVPAMPTMPALPSAEAVKESVKYVSTEVLARGKEFFSLNQPLSSLAPRAASITAAYFMVTYLQDLCDQVPSFKRFKRVLKNVFVRIALAATGAFAADQMSAAQIKYVMGAITTFYLIVRYFGLKPALKRLALDKQDAEVSFRNAQALNNRNNQLIDEKNDLILELRNKIQRAVEDVKNKRDELVSAQDEIAVLNAKITALEEQKSLMKNHQNLLNQDLQNELKASNEEKEILEKQILLLSSNDTNSLNHDLKVQLTLFAAERISLENKIKQLEEEKNALANALTRLNDEWTLLEATTALTVEDSELSDSKYNTPNNSPIASAENSDEDYQDALTDQEDNN